MISNLSGKGRSLLILSTAFSLGINLPGPATAAEAPSPPPLESPSRTAESQSPITELNTGPRTRLRGNWVGRQPVSPSLKIVVMAGHADSQGMHGSGTPGAAVDQRGEAPMDPRMRDELFWNRKVRDAVVALSKQKGLNIIGYDPGALSIAKASDPRTNWSVARRLSRQGDYILEIHFDAYSPHGYGSGLIPALNRNLNRVDESLAQSFGRFPRLFRGGLGGPRRGISILEIGMLEGILEANLRNPKTREATIQAIALQVTDALMLGLRGKTSSNPPPGVVDNAPPTSNPQTNSEVE